MSHLKLQSWALDLSEPWVPSNPIRESHFHMHLVCPDLDTEVDKPMIVGPSRDGVYWASSGCF